MTTHHEKTREAILGAPAPRNLSWRDFVHMWENIADEVKEESGDRLSVSLNGHREVFRRPHDGVVSIEDIENARHLLRDTPIEQGHGSVFVVTVDAENARLIDFDLDSVKVDAGEHDVHDPDPRSRRLRTVEKRTGDEDIADLDRFYRELAAAITAELGPSRTFVLLGHGAGKSDVAENFLKWLDTHEAQLAARVAGSGALDLSAATTVTSSARHRRSADRRPARCLLRPETVEGDALATRSAPAPRPALTTHRRSPCRTPSPR